MHDLVKLKKAISTPVPINLEMAVTEEILAIAENVKPAHCCFVPEKRAELTTEGGLDVVGQQVTITKACQRLIAKGIVVSLFIDPDSLQIEAAKQCGATVIELTTSQYAEAKTSAEQALHLQRIQSAVKFADQLGLIVNAGHGLNYDNVQPIAAIEQINELNIGHSLIGYAIYWGIEAAVQKMKSLMHEARQCDSLTLDISKPDA